MAVRRRTLGKKKRMTRRITNRGNKMRMTRRRFKGGTDPPTAYQIISSLNTLIITAGYEPHRVGLEAQRKFLINENLKTPMSSLTLNERAEVLKSADAAYVTAFINAGGTNE